MSGESVAKSSIVGNIVTSLAIGTLVYGCVSSGTRAKPAKSSVEVEERANDPPDYNGTMINGAPIICDREAYNCPSYSGPYQEKRLENCEDVKAVWDKCGSDVHDLDRDGDGIPCEEDCG